MLACTVKIGHTRSGTPPGLWIVLPGLLHNPDGVWGKIWTDHPLCLTPNIKKRCFFFLSLSISVVVSLLGSQIHCGEASPLPGFPCSSVLPSDKNFKSILAPGNHPYYPKLMVFFHSQPVGMLYLPLLQFFPLLVRTWGLSWNHLLPFVICDLNLSRHEMLI